MNLKPPPGKSSPAKPVSQRAGRKSEKRRKKSGQLLLEELEPRILLSAVPAPEEGGGADQSAEAPPQSGGEEGATRSNPSGATAANDAACAADQNAPVEGEQVVIEIPLSEFKMEVASYGAGGTEETSQKISELVVVDGAIPGAEQLAHSLAELSDRPLRVELLGAGADPLAEITRLLDQATADGSKVTGLHLISHGAPGQLKLGGVVFDAGQFAPGASGATALAAWQPHLAEGADILLYGCDIGAGAGGIALLDNIAAASRADIAASTDTTGSAAQGGNWILEASRGLIQSGALSSPLDITLASSIPAVTLAAPGSVAIGQSFSVQVSFDNLSPAQPGYGPYIDVFIDRTGADGIADAANPANPQTGDTNSVADPGDFYDGFTITTPPTYLGVGMTYTVLTLDNSANGGLGVKHPYAVDQAGNAIYVRTNGSGEIEYFNAFTSATTTITGTSYGNGDQLMVIELPFGSFTPDQPPAEVSFGLTLSNHADVNVPLNITSVGGFRYGDTPLADYSSDPSIIGVANSVQVGVNADLARLTKTYNGPENETATGPNYLRSYTINVDIADGQTFSDLHIFDDLDPRIQFTQILGASHSYTVLNLPSTTVPGGKVAIKFDTPVTGGAGGSDAWVQIEFYVPRLYDSNNSNSIDGGDAPVLAPNSGADFLIDNQAYGFGLWDPIDPRDPDTVVGFEVDTGTFDPTSIATALATAAPDANFEHNDLEASPLVIQKGLSQFTNTGAAGPTPGDVYTFTLDFQVSDYFGVEGVVVTDLIRDGLRLDPTFTPTLQINGNTYVLGTAGWTLANWTIKNNYSGPSATSFGNEVAATGNFVNAPALIGATTLSVTMEHGFILGRTFTLNGATYRVLSSTVPSSGGTGTITLETGLVAAASVGDLIVDGTTTLEFRVSNEIITRGQNGKMVGGGIDPSNPDGNIPNNLTGYNDGPTRGLITYRAIIQDKFTDDFPSGEESVNPRDSLSNTVRISANILDIDHVSNTLPPYSGPVTTSDDSGAGLTIVNDVVQKSIYAINGSTNLSPYTDANGKVNLQPGYQITYRFQFNIPSGDIEKLRFTDFLPLPVFKVGDPNADGIFNNVGAGEWVFVDNLPSGTNTYLSGTPPPTSTITYGPTHTLHTVSDPASPVPVITIDTVTNSIRIQWGDFINTANDQKKVDLLFTATVNALPFADGLFLTNQVQSGEGNTQAPGTESLANAIIQIVINQPDVHIQKGVVASTQNGSVGTVGGIAFNDLSGHGFSGILTGESNAKAIGQLDLLTGTLPDAGDTVRFAIVAQNTGRSDAFDVRVTDTILPAFVDSYASTAAFLSGTNFKVYRGSDGATPLNGVVVDDFVRSASTANYASFTGVSFIMDGVTLANGDRVLLKDQTIASQNGVYVVSGVNTLLGTMNLTPATGSPASVAVYGGNSSANLRYTVSGTTWSADPASGTYDYFVNFNTTTKSFTVLLNDNYSSGNVGGDDKNAGLSRGYNPSIDGDITNGSNSIIILYDLTVDSDAGAGSETRNVAFLTNYAGLDAADDHTADDLSEAAKVRFRTPEFSKTLISSEIVHYDAIATAATTASIADLANAPTTIDGVALEIGDIVLVKNQAAAAENGLYQVTALGGTATLTRAAFFDTAPEVAVGYSVLVTRGTANAGAVYLQQNTVATLGTDPISFVLSPSHPAAGLRNDTVVAVAVGNIPNGVYNPAGGIGAAPGTGSIIPAPATIDGVSLKAGDRVLLAGQTNPVQNGIYEVVPLGAFNALAKVVSSGGALINPATGAYRVTPLTVDGVTLSGGDLVLVNNSPFGDAYNGLYRVSPTADLTVSAATTGSLGGYYTTGGLSAGGLAGGRYFNIPASIDGVNISAGDLVLIKNPGTGEEAGIFEAFNPSLPANINATVKLATTGALTGAVYTTTPSNGRFTNVATTIDGVSLAIGDRVLVKNQADAKQNGVYSVTALSGTATLTRATDFDSNAEHIAGTVISVTHGTANGGRIYFLNTDGSSTLNTTNLPFIEATGLALRRPAAYDTPAELSPGGIAGIVVEVAGGTANAGLRYAATSASLTASWQQTAGSWTRDTSFDDPVEITSNYTVRIAQGTLNAGSNFVLVSPASPAVNTDPIIFVKASGALVRAADADSSAELPAGRSVQVLGGSSHGGRTFKLTTPNAVINTSALVFDDVTPANAVNQLAPGEIATYQLRIRVPEGTTTLRITDVLDANLGFVDVVSVIGSAGVSLDANGPTTSSNVTYNHATRTITFGNGTFNVTNTNSDNATPEYLYITYRAIALNEAANQAAVTADNLANFQHDFTLINSNGSPNPQTSLTNVAGPSVQIVEPFVQIAKQISADGTNFYAGLQSPINNGDTVHYRIVISSGTLGLAAPVSDFVHHSVKAATTGSVGGTFSATGGGTGGQFTGVSLTIDGVTLNIGDRLLVKNQATASQNGIYIVTAAGTLTRVPAFDENNEGQAGIIVGVEQGTANAGSIFKLRSDVPTINTSGVTFDLVQVRDVKAATNGISLSTGATATTLTGLGLSHAGALVIDGVTLAVGDRVLIKDENVSSRNGVYTVTTVASNISRTLAQAAVAGNSSILVSGDQTASLSVGQSIALAGQPANFKITSLALQGGNTVVGLDSLLYSNLASGSTVQAGSATLTRVSDLDADADFDFAASGLAVRVAAGNSNAGRTFNLANTDPSAITVGTTAISFAPSADAFDLTLDDTLPDMFAGAPAITAVVSTGASSLHAGDLEIVLVGSNYVLRTKPGVSFDLPAGTQIAITLTGTIGGANILPSANFINDATVAWTSLDGSPGERTTTVPGTGDTERTGADGIGGLNNYVNSAAAALGIETPLLIKHIVSSSLSTTNQPLVLADFSSTGFTSTTGTWTGQTTTNATYLTIGGSATENGSGTFTFATPIDMTGYGEIGVRLRALAANDADNLRVELIDSDGTVIRSTIALNDVNLPPGGLTFQQLTANIATGTIQAAGSIAGFDWKNVAAVRLAGDGGSAAMRLEVDQIVALTTNAVPGEIVRYRLIVELPEAGYPDLQILDAIPSGMSFLNDGTARVAFVSTTAGNITSTDSGSGASLVTGIGAAAHIIGNQNSLTSIDLSPGSGNGYALLDNNISTSNNTNSDTYGNDTDVRFKLGNVVNTENDADKEYIIIEFNALVRNDNNATTTDGSLTQAGATLQNSFQSFINGSTTPVQVGNATGFGAATASASNNAFNNVIVAEPQINNLALGYDGTAPVDAGDTFTIKAEFSNGANPGQEYAPTVKVATTAALSGGAFASGTFTGVSAPGGVLTIDGQTIGVGERILLNRGSSQAENGVYVVTQIDARNGVATLTRDTDFNSPEELSLGARVAVTHGTSAGRTFVQETTGAITVNTTSLVFSATDAVTPFAGYTTAVRAASTGNVTLSSPGASLDGITLVAGDRVLLKNQTTAAQNGVYIFNGAASALTRAEDFDSTAATEEFALGRQIFVQEGATNGNRTFAVTTGTSANRIVEQADAYDTTLNIFLDPKALFNSVTIQTPDGNTSALTVDGAWSVGAYSGTVDVPTLLTTGNIVVTLDRLPPEIDITTAKKNITVLVSATLDVGLQAGEQLSTLAQLTYSSLPGATGTPGGSNPTGSTTPGAAGSETGERNGSQYDSNPADATPGSQINNTHPEFNNANRNNYAVAAQLLSIAPAPTIDKSFKDGSLTDDDSSVTTSTGGELVVGEQVTFDILVTLPEGVSKDVRITDIVPSGMFLVSHQVITTAAGSARLAADFNGTIGAPTLSTSLPAGNGVSVTFDFDDITVTNDNVANNNSFVLRVVLQVSNIIANQDGTFLTNEARLTYSDPDGLNNGGAPGDVTVFDSTNTSGDDTIDPGTTPFDPTVVVREPVLTIAKSLPFGDTVADAGDTITYRLTINNTSAQVAYEVVLRDVLDAFLSSPAVVSVTTSGFGSFPAPVPTDFEFAVVGLDTVLRLAAGGPLGGDLDMPPGSQIVIDFTAVLSNSVTNGQPILNKSVLFWSTTPGGLVGDDPAAANQERTGGDIPNPTLGTPNPAILNNQAVSSSVVSTAVSPIIISQQIIDTSHDGLGATTESGSPQKVNATIGEFVTYKLTISLPEGTTNNLVIDIDLPTGLAFDPSFTPIFNTLAGDIPDASYLHDSHATSGLSSFNGTGITDGGTVGVIRSSGSGVYGSGDNIRFIIPGPIVVAGDNDVNNNTFTITYRALVLDEAGNDGLLPGLTTLTPSATFVSGNVVAATTANLAGATFNPSGGSNGKGGFTSAPTTLDGVTLANGNLVLVKNQTNQAQNGIYLVTNAAAGTWERWDHFDDNAEVTSGYRVEVTGGNTNVGTAWTQSTSGVVVNSSNIVFASASPNAVLNDTAANGAPDSFGITTTVVEPELDIVKELSINGSPFASTATGDAGDIVTYRVTVSHTAASAASAWDLRLDDVIPSGVTGLTLTSATITDGAGGQADRNVLGSFLFTGNILSTVESGANDSVDLYFDTGGALGSEQLVLIFTGVLATTLAPGSSSLLAGDVIDLTYNSLPHEVTAQQTNLISDAASQGGSTGITSTDQERHRTDSSSVSITVPSALTLAKSVIATSHTVTGGTTGNDLAIGETATYRVNVTLQEGLTALFTLNDSTPAGLVLVPSAGGTGIFFRSADGATAKGFNSNTLYTDGSEILAADITDSTSPSSPGSLQVRLKDVHLPSADGLDTDSFQIDYTLRAANAAINQAESSPSKTNTATALADRNADGDTSDPGESVTADATVVIKEPVLTLDKTTTTTGSDSGDTVVYTLVINNTGNATAYDINILDTLDAELELATPASALAITVNPGYASLDQAGNTSSAVSTILNELRPGDSVTVTITARIRQDANPNDIVTNTASITYTSLPGADSNERNGGGGINDYSTSDPSDQFQLATPTIVKSLLSTTDPNTGASRHVPANTDLAIGEVVTYTITVTFTEGVTNAVTVSDFGQDNASGILEILSATVSSVGANLSAVGGSEALTVGTTVAPSNSGGSAFNDTVSFNFGNVTNTFDNSATAADQVVITVTARVANHLNNQDGDTLLNTGRLTYTDGQGVTQNIESSVSVDVVEPRVTVDKTVTSATTGLDAGDSVTFSVTINNLAANGATGPAYDVTLNDLLSGGLIISSISSPALSGGATVDTALSGVGTGNLTGVFDIPLGGSVTFTYTATLPNSTTPGQAFTNDIDVVFSSQDGVVTGERTGADVSDPEDNTPPDNGSILNNYAVGDEVAFSAVNPFSIAKSLLSSDVSDTTGANLTIGEIATFQIAVTVMEGTTNNISIIDTLPVGLVYVPGSATVSNANGITVNGFNASISGQVLTLTATSAVNPGGSNSTTNDPASTETDTFFITYQARVTNVAGNQGDSGSQTTLTNDADATADDVPPDNDNQVTLTVVEPVLTIDKEITSPTSNLDAGDQITYQITVSHSALSTAKAYDLILNDTFPAGELENFTLVSATIGVTDVSSAFNLTTGGVLSTTGNVDLGLTESLVLTVTANVKNALNVGTIINNTATVLWSSLDGGLDGDDSGTINERTGAGDNPPNNYTVSDSVSTQTVGVLDVVKTRDKATATIGEEITYTITITVAEGRTVVSLIDTLPAGLSLKPGSMSLTPAAGMTISGFVADSLTQTLTVLNDGASGGNPNSGATLESDSFTWTYTAVVQNVLANQSGATLINDVDAAADLNNDGDTSDPGETDNNNSTTVTVVEPRVTIDKSATPTSGLNGGDVVTYTIVIDNLAANGATSTAFDAVYVDQIPAGLLATSIVSVTPSGGTTIDSAVAITGGGTGLTGTFDIPVNGSVTIVYEATVQPSFVPGQTLVNDANVHYTSLDGAVSGERTGGDIADPEDNTPPGIDTPLNNYAVGDDASVTGAAYNPLVNKSVFATSEGATGFTLTTADGLIGEVVRFQLKFELFEGTLNELVIHDLLPVGMIFLNDGTASFTTVGVATTVSNSLFLAHDSLTGSGTSFTDGADVFFKLGTVVNNDNDADVEYGVIRFNALVLNTLANQNAVTLDNRFAVYYDSDNNAGTDPAQVTSLRVDADDNGTPELTGQSLSNTVTVTIREPVLSFNQVIPAGSGYDAGDVFTITYTVTNTGNAPAYNVRLDDLTLPAEFDLTAISAVSSGSGTSDTSATNLTADAIDATIDVLEVGQTWTVTATITLRNSVNPADSYTNPAEITFTSLPGANGTTGNGTGSDTPGVAGTGTGERTGVSPNLQGDGSLNDYRLTDSEGLSIGAPFAVTKVADKATATIGEVITYTVTVTVIQGTTTNIVLNDTLPSGVAFVANSAVLTAGAMTVTGFNPNSVDQTLTSVVNPGANDAFATSGDTATNSFSYTYQAVVLDVPSNDGVSVAGDGDGQTDLVNDLDASADDVPDDNNNTATVTVVEPLLSITKSHDDADREVTPGQEITYSLLVQHRPGSTATAFDVAIRDFVPAGLTYVTGTATVSATTGSPVGVSVSGSGAAIIGTIDELPLGSTVTITYKVLVNLTASPGANLDNNVRVYWDTLPDNDDNVEDPLDSSTPADGGDRDYGPDTPGVIESPNPSADTDPGQDTERVTVGTATISNFVWHDLNGDGIQDPLEKGIPGVRVYLDLDNSGTFDPLTEISSVTDVFGEYLLSGLAAGTYTVRIDTTTLPSSVTGTFVFDDPDVPGAPSATGHVTFVELASGENETRADFGYIGSAALGDIVWLDIDNSGAQNGLEPGIGGVLLELLRDLNGDGDATDPGEGVIATTITSSITATLGQYTFTGLIGGNYIVRVAASNFNPGGVLEAASQTYDRDNDAGYGNVALDNLGHSVLGATETDNAVDFGYRGAASLGDRVWFDFNSDGAQDANEPGIPGVPVRLYIDVNNDGNLDAGDLQIDSQITGVNGAYLFSGLIAGNYLVAVDTFSPLLLIASNTFDRDDVGPGTDLDSVGSEALGASEAATLVDFGYSGGYTITGLSYHDLLKNSFFDGSDTGIGNVLIDLFWDTNNDGAIDGGDFLLGSTLTASNGTFNFSGLLPGNYLVRENQPAGFGNSENSSNLLDVTILNSSVTAPSFGNTSGSISGKVYRDDNDNGLFDPLTTEIPLSNVTVTLEWSGADGIFGNADDRTVSTTTDASGNYLFDHSNTAGFYAGFGDSNRGLLSTGVYRISETQPFVAPLVPYLDGADAVGNAAGNAGTVNGASQGRDGTDLLSGIVLGAGQDAIGYNFGERSPVDLVVTKTDGLSTATPGQVVTYSIVVSNVGAQWANLVIVTDTLPVNVNFISASNGGVFNPATRQVIWDSISTPELAQVEGLSTEVITLTITAQVQSSLPLGTTTLTNTVTVTDDGSYGLDADPSNNTAVDITTVTVNPPPPIGGGGGGGGIVPKAILPSLPEGPFYVYDLFFNPAERFRFFGDRDEIILPLRGIEPLVEPPLTLLPVFSGRVEPGSTVVLEIYNDRGEVIGSQTVVADAGGNWLTTFPTTIIRDNPHEVRMRQTAPSLASAGGFGFNFRTYFAPAVNTGLFTFEPLTVDKVMDRRLPGTILLMQKADEGVVILDGWASFDYEYHCAPGLPSGN